MTLGTSIPGLCQLLFWVAEWGEALRPSTSLGHRTGGQQAPPGPLRCDAGVQPPVDATSPCGNVGATGAGRAPVSLAGRKAQCSPPCRPRRPARPQLPTGAARRPDGPL